MIIEDATLADQHRSLPRADSGPSEPDPAGRRVLTQLARHLIGLRKALTVAALIAAVQAGLVLWFTWPATNAAPRDLPVVVAGPPAGVERVTRMLTTMRSGGFEVRAVADQAAADQALRDRKAYAAFLVDGTGMTVHLASAANPTVATVIDSAVQGINAKSAAERGGTLVKTVDVVATPGGDPRGAGFTAGFLPLLMTSIVCGVLLSFMVTALPVRLLGLLAFGGLSGLGGALALTAGDVVSGNYLVIAAALGLLTLAISSALCGLGSLLGRGGIGFGVITVFFLGNPIAGLTAAPEMLPSPWGTIGQLLPPGAGATLLRSVAFFHRAGAGQPTLVLAGWALAGLALCVAGTLRAAAVVRNRQQPELA